MDYPARPHTKNPCHWVLHQNALSKHIRSENIIAKPEGYCNMISYRVLLLCPLPIDAPDRGGANDKIQIPVFCGFTNQIWSSCLCRFQ